MVAKLLGTDRFCNIAVRSGRQTLLFVPLHGIRGHGHDRQVNAGSLLAAANRGGGFEPAISAIGTSIRIRAKVPFSRAARASWPLSTVVTMGPPFWMSRRGTAWFTGVSSAPRTLT